MKKLQQGRKFGRKRDQRKAFLKALATALILREKIKTTEARAKEIKPLVEKLITRAQKNNLASRKLLSKFLAAQSVKKLCDEIAPRYKERKGGYTRIVKLGLRKGDGAKMAIIELIHI